MRSRPAISTRRMIGLTDRADGRASFLRAPDTVAPPVALEPDNSPYRSPRSPATKRFQPASNLFPGALGPSSAAARGVGKTPRCRARTRDLARLRAALARQEAPGVFLYAFDVLELDGPGPPPRALGGEAQGWRAF